MAFSVVIYYAGSAGDLITAIPIAELIHRTRPGCEIVWICKTGTEELFRLFGPRVRPVTTGRAGLLRTERFDLAIDLTGSRAGKSLLAGLNASRRVTPGRHLDHGRGRAGKHKRRPSFWAALPGPRAWWRLRRLDMPTTTHISHRLQDFVADALGVGRQHICPSDCVKAEYRWSPPLGGENKLYYYHDSKHEHKLWPTANVEAFVSMAQGTGFGQPCVVIDGAKKALAGGTLAGNSRVVPIKRSWSFQIDWIRSAGVVVGPDTAPIHLAGALGAPTIALFGPTPRGRCAVLGPRVENMQHPTCAFPRMLQPCWHRIPTWRVNLVHFNPLGGRFLHCRHSHCMHALEPDAVFKRACDLLDQYRSPSDGP